MVAINPVGCVRLYLAAAAPVKVLVEVTGLSTPALASAKVPDKTKVTASVPTSPPASVPVIAAVVDWLYILDVATAFAIVKAFTLTTNSLVRFVAGL
ncbi:hypothetical protein MCEGE10_02911 [Flavobacteriaceae bacterium]